LCCFPVLLAQVLTRLRLTWDGHETTREEGRDYSNIKDHGLRREKHSKNVTFLTIVLSFVGALTLGYIPALGTLVLCLFYLVLSVWVGGNLRRYVRQRYGIVQGCSLLSDGIEDRCTMCFCTCCAIIQVARHTHDDKEYPGYCCSTTGLEYGAPPGAPAYNVGTKESTLNSRHDYLPTRQRA
jgi:PLAC8 family